MTTFPLPIEACLDIRLVYSSIQHFLAFTKCSDYNIFLMKTKSVIVHHEAFITVNISRILMELCKKSSLKTLYQCKLLVREKEKTRYICIYKLSVAVGQQE